MLATLVHRTSSSAELQACRLATARCFSCLPSLTDAAVAVSDALLPLSPLVPTPPPAADALEAAGPFVGATMTAIDSLHSSTGLPWWVTIVGVGLTVRTAMLPISLKGMKASAALFPIIQQARAEEEQNALKLAASAGAPRSSSSSFSEETTDSPNEKAGVSARYSSIIRRFHELRVQQGAPHPFWVIGSPLLQLPVFITSMMAIRSMAVQNWPGFSSGGVGWFPDLTLPAIDLATLTTPMGVAGAILPMTIALSMLGNIDAAFGGANRSAAATGQSPTVMVWVMGKVRLALEWAVLPLFVAALQLPQGGLCYWATSSLYALIQNHILKVPVARQALGLPTHPGSHRIPSSSSIKPAEAASPFSDGDGPAMSEDIAEAFNRAAQLRATGDFAGAADALEEILARSPEHARALFALGQVRSGLKEWGPAGHAYLQATRYESDEGQKCRSWFGAGVAFHMQGREEDALEAFRRAAGPEANERLRVQAWVAAATLEEKLGRREAAVVLLKKAAKVEPKVEDYYLKPLLEGKMDVSRNPPAAE